MAYYTLILLFAINMVNYLDRYLVSGALSGIQDGLKLNDGQAGALMTAFIVVYMCASPLFGWLGDRYSRKYLVAIGIGLWSFATIGAYWARNFHQLLFTRAIVGIGEASYATTAPTVISDFFPTESRGRALSFFYMAIPVGSALGFALGGWIAAHYGWRYAFLTMGIPGLLLAFLMLSTTREPQRGQCDGLTEVNTVPWGEALLRLWRNPSFILITLGLSAMTFAMGGMAHWMPTFLHRCRDIPKETAGLYFGGVTVVAGFLGTLVGGWLGDWYRKRHSGAYFIVCGVGMLLGIPFAVIALASPIPYLFWPGIFLAEFFLFLNTGPGNAIIANVTAPAMRATAFAVNTFFIHLLGDAISPAAIGMVSDLFRQSGVDKNCSLEYSMYLMPVMMVASGVLFLLGAPHLAKDTVGAKGYNHDNERNDHR